MNLLRSGTILLAMAASYAWAGANEGKELYTKSCKTCHGVDGQGNPAVAKMMKIEFRPLDSQEVQAKSDAELKSVITEGKGKMKPVTSLKGKQVDDVVAYIRTLKK